MTPTRPAKEAFRHRAPGRRADDHRDEVSDLRRQLRAAKEQARRSFDLGFVAAVRMVEAGATLERLRIAAQLPVRPNEYPVVTARGTMDLPAEPVVATDPTANTIPMFVPDISTSPKETR